MFHHLTACTHEGAHTHDFEVKVQYYYFRFHARRIYKYTTATTNCHLSKNVRIEAMDS